jgi:DNA-binding response OmpR family regulator
VLLQKGSGDILLAEDDEQTRTFIHRALSEHGFRVTAVTEGSEALALIRSNKSLPDLLIADVVMPAMTGTELAARIRDQHPELSVLFISGYTDDQLSPDLLDERTDFLRKPFGQTELLDRVMARLGRRP